MKLAALALLLMFPLVLLSAAVTVVSESENELVLEFSLPEYRIEHQKINGATWQSIASDEGSIHAREGFPELRFFSEAVAIPVDGGISVQVSEVNSAVLQNINLKPVYKRILEKEEVDYVFYQDPAAYRSSQAWPQSIVQAGESAYVGDRNFIPLHIYPFQYRASRKELVVNTSFRINVRILGAKSATSGWQTSENPIDQVGDSFFLNNASSLSWRLPKARDDSYEAPKNGTSLVNEIQLIVDEEGIYKVTYAQLDDFITMMTDSLGVEMAWDPDTVDPRFLELRDEFGSIPIHFEGESDGSFNSQDYFEFFGDRHYGDEGYMDDYTAENVYSLALKNTYGARMAVENGGLIVSNPSEYIVPDAFEHTVHIEEQLVSDKLGNSWTDSDPDFFKEDTWFWKKIQAPNLEIIPFELQYPKDSQIRYATTKVSLYGLTYAPGVPANEYDHQATVRINQAMINSHTWTGQKEKIFYNASPTPNSYFHHGTNHMYISLSGNTLSGTEELVLLDYLELTYWREYRTNEDKIKFSKPSNRPPGLYQFEVSGFSNNEVSVYKIGSSIFNSCQIEPFNIEGAVPWTVTIQDSVSSNEVQYYAVAESEKLAPKEFRLNIPSDLKNPANAANVIVVGRRDFLASEGGDLLIDTWEAGGHIVSRVDYQDIFDEFNHGIRSAESLKEFFTYAYNNWSSPQLTHVILLGEGIEDERDNSPARQYALVPVKRTWTSEHGSTASDGWYATIVGEDLVPDICVARINAWKPEHVLDFANKAFEYRNNPMTSRLWNSHLTISSGGKLTDANDLFAQQSERIRRKCIPRDYRVTRVYTSTQTVSPDYFGGTFDLKDAINSGTQYLHFIGHGGGRIWADYNLFNFNDVATLNNQTYPIVLSLACYASAFDTNGINSIGEVLVMEPNKGAIATLGFSGLGYKKQDEDWGLAFTEALFKHDFDTLGEAYQYTLARFYVVSSLRKARYALTNAAALLGDPLIHTLKPINGIPVSATQYLVQPGDTLHVQAQFPPEVMAARLYVMNSDEIVQNIAYDLPVINGEFNASHVIPEDVEAPYMNRIYVAGYSLDNEYVGESMFGVGNAAIMHHSTLPENPTWADSVEVLARIFTNENVVSFDCHYTTNIDTLTVNWITLPMEPHPQIANAYVTTQRIPPQSTGQEVTYKYVVTTENETHESFLNNYVTRGPDLILGDIRLDTSDSGQNLEVFVRNVGDAASIPTDLRLYVRPAGGAQTLFSTQDIAGLEIDEERWETIPLAGLEPGEITFEVRVNWTLAFPEWDYSTSANNIITLVSDFNYYSVGSTGDIISSIDENLSCEIPQGLVPDGQESIFYVNGMGELTANNQPDIFPIKLLSYDTDPSSIPSNAYEIGTLNPALVDTTDTLINNIRFKLTFYYSADDAETQALEAENSYKIYRWDARGSKWILQGGNISATEDKVVFEVSRQGIYTIYRNTDRIRPSIDMNVQDQEFTVGGYISGTGTISLVLSDANGIDVFDNTIRLYLNGSQIPETDYVTSINTDNVNRIPIKYQIDLGQGNYTLVIDCKDVNGNFNTREVQFLVNETFDVINVANYPNPVSGHSVDPKNDGRTRFTYVLTDDADEVTIKVYTVAGRLAKVFDNLPAGVGYHEYPRTLYGWDCKDDFGYPLANGVYFYKIIARKGGKKIEKTMKMAIIK